MSQMVERVARKLAGQYMIDDGFGEDSRESAERGEMWLNFRKAATVAILALREPTDEMLEVALDESGQRVAPYTAPRESGVALECDLSEEDAADINRDLKDQHATAWMAMIDAALSIQKRENG